MLSAALYELKKEACDVGSNAVEVLILNMLNCPMPVLW